MSYDIELVDPSTGRTLEADTKHQIRGGTYVVGGTTDLEMNVTYNYGSHYYRVLDSEKGIRAIYGLTGAQSIPVLKEAISKLGDEVSMDYWESTEGNAKQALLGLLSFAEMRPDGVWRGD